MPSGSFFLPVDTFLIVGRKFFYKTDWLELERKEKRKTKGKEADWLVFISYSVQAGYLFFQ